MGGFRVRIFLALVFLILLATMIASVSLSALRSVAAAKDVVLVRYAQGALEAERLRSATFEIAWTLRRFLLTGDRDVVYQLRGVEQDQADSLQRLRFLAERSEGRELMDQIEAEEQEYSREAARLIRLREAGGSPSDVSLEAREKELTRIGNRLRMSITALIARKDRLLEEAKRDARIEVQKMRQTLLWVATVGVALTAALGLLFGRAMLRLKNTETQLAQTARMRENMMAIVSHDLKNPLAAVTMSAGLLQRFCDRSDLPKADLARRQVQLVQTEARRMARLIEDLLDLGRIQGGRLVLNPSVQDAGMLIQESLEHMAVLANAKSIHLSARPPVPPLTVLSDHDRTLQVFSNLIGNAIKFTPAGGEISVGVRREGNSAVFFVRDTGPGIPPQHFRHLFDPFWQARDTAAQGTGLGLTIARGIVEQQGGRIWVRSRPGQGATFLFSVSLAEKKEPSQEAA